MTTTPSKRRPSRKQVVTSPTIVSRPKIEVVNSSVSLLIPANQHNSLTAWFELYVKLDGAAKSTLADKQRDIRLFVGYFNEATGTDIVDDWTRSITRGFLTWLEDKQHQKPNTINRRLATLKHASKWIASQRHFIAGNPTDSIGSLVEDEAEWLGLEDLHVTRLRAAAEQLVAIRQGKNQRPNRDYAYFTVLLLTGLRSTEVLSLDLASYEGKHLVNIRGKGKQRTRQKFLPTEARELLDRYIELERGRGPGALFLSNLGQRWSRSKAHEALKRIERQANANLPDDQKFEFSAHVLRHTHLRKLTEKHGMQYAKDESGHTSFQHLQRYVRPRQSELEAALEGLHG